MQIESVHTVASSSGDPFHASVHCTLLGADAEVNRQGIEAVKSVLKEARKIARTLPPEKRAAIEEMCNEIEALMQELADLQARGLVSECVWDVREEILVDRAVHQGIQWNLRYKGPSEIWTTSLQRTLVSTPC